VLTKILTKFGLGIASSSHELAIKLIFGSKFPISQQQKVAKEIIKDYLTIHAPITMMNLSEHYSGYQARCFHEELLAWALQTGSLRFARLYAAHLGRELTKEEAQHILETDVHRNSMLDSDVPIFTSLGVIPADPSRIEHSVKKNLKSGLKIQTVRILEKVGLTLDDFKISPEEMNIYECAAATKVRY
jgi:hypothetical protein